MGKRGERTGTVCCILAGAALAIGGLGGSPVLAQTQPLSVLMFHCHVEAGPKFTGCQAESPGDLDPRKVENLRLALEATPPCLMPSVRPGWDVDKSFSYVDSPALLNPPPTGPARHTIINPDWAEKPPAELMDKVYPKAARAARMTGRAVLDCNVTAEGATTDCKVVEETPTGQGFGEAALSASHEFHMKPRMVDCKPVDGARIRLPVNFNLRN